MTGVKIANWILGPEIGRGPIGVVYRATAADDPKRFAAVKILTHELARTPAFQEWFTAEMLILHRLNHPNIARFYDSGIHAGTAYYATEWIDGTDLATVLKENRKPEEPGLSWKDAVLSIAVQTSRALKHGHHRSILHRGLKPTNLILQADGVLKVTDFGVGKLFLASPLNLPADATDTIGFLAPEFFTGKPLTRRSDLYSLGGVLYLLLTGRPPFSANTAAEFMHKHCYVLPDRPIQFVPKLPTELDELVCLLLTKDPNRRPSAAPVVIAELDRIRGKAERRGEKISWPEAEGDGTGTMAALSAEIEAEAAWGSRPKPWMSRPLVVIPMFLAVLGVGAMLYFWPRPSADELYHGALPLLASEDPADWDRAWTEYLEPLTEKYPEQYVEEVREAKRRMAERKKLKRAVDDAAKLRPVSDAERLYGRGLVLLQNGEAPAAKQTWRAVEKLYGPQIAERHWVELANLGLAELEKKTIPADSTRLQGIRDVLERAKDLKSQGRPEAAEALIALLESVHRDDPAAMETIKQGK